jgi:hypothetical protein
VVGGGGVENVVTCNPRASWRGRGGGEHAWNVVCVCPENLRGPGKFRRVAEGWEGFFRSHRNPGGRGVGEDEGL